MFTATYAKAFTGKPDVMTCGFAVFRFPGSLCPGEDQGPIVYLDLYFM